MKKIFFLMFFLIVLAFNLQAQNLGKIYFDEAHGQPFSISKDGHLQLSGFAKVFKDAGFDVSVVTDKISFEKLKDAKALIISGAFKELSNEELDAVFKFVDNGGKVLVNVHIPQPLTSFLNKLDVAVTTIPIKDENSPLKDKKVDFGVYDLSEHRIFKDLKRFFVYGSWGFKTNNPNIKLLAKSGRSSYLDLNRNNQLDKDDEMGPFGLIVEIKLGKGSVMLIGDDTLFQNMFLSDYNLKLAQNLANYFKGE